MEEQMEIVSQELLRLATLSHELYVDARKASKDSKDSKDYFTHCFPLTQEGRKWFEQEEASLEILLHHFLPRWKEEGRLSLTGSLVTLNETEGIRLKLPDSIPISIYSIFRACIQFLVLS
jgi:hypothetical protein